MTNEEAETFLDNLKVCIEEHPIVADWLVEIADRKNEPQTEKFPQKWTDWCKECGKKERCVRAGFMPQCYESEDEPQTERSE